MIKKLINKIKTVWPNLVYLKYGKSIKPLYRFLRPYYMFRHFRPFWLYVLNRTARKLYLEDKNPLNKIQERIVNDLKKDGIAITHIDELFPGKNLLPQLQKYAETSLNAGNQRTKGKLYVMDLVDKTDLDLNNPFLKFFILTPEVVGIANAYMGMYSKFFTFLLTLVSPVGDTKPISSQRWHRDPEDKKLCKPFIYLNDVDEETGPLHYIAGSHADGRWSNLFSQKPPQGCIDIDENAIKRIVPPEDIRQATGKAGTIIFCDTAGIHRGGHARSKHRIAFNSGFCSSASLWATKFNYAENYNAQVNSVSDKAVKYALKLWYARK